MLIFKKAHDGTLEIDGLRKIAQTCDVTTEGVKGAKTFFEAKVTEISRASKFEQEIKGKLLVILCVCMSYKRKHAFAHRRGARKEEEGVRGGCREEESIQGEGIQVALASSN